jgi:hypothetical protein
MSASPTAGSQPAPVARPTTAAKAVPARATRTPPSEMRPRCDPGELGGIFEPVGVAMAQASLDRARNARPGEVIGPTSSPVRRLKARDAFPRILAHCPRPGARTHALLLSPACERLTRRAPDDRTSSDSGRTTDFGRGGGRLCRSPAARRASTPRWAAALQRHLRCAPHGAHRAEPLRREGRRLPHRCPR